MSFKALVTALSEQCHEIKQALSLFPYFDTWDNERIAECCRISSIVEYSPDQIILEFNSPNSHMVFFVIEGICKVLQYVQMRVNVDSHNKTHWKPYKSENFKSSTGNLNKEGFASLLLNKKHLFKNDQKSKKNSSNTESIRTIAKIIQSKVTEENKSVEIKSTKLSKDESQQQENNTLNGKDLMALPDSGIQKEGHPNVEFDVGNDIKNDNQDETETLVSSSNIRTEDINSEKEAIEKELEKKEKYCDETETPTKEKFHFENELLKDSNNHIEVNFEEAGHAEAETEDCKMEKKENVDEIAYDDDHHLKVLKECKAVSDSIIKQTEVEPTSKKPKNVKGYFVQVALFYKGACFGLDESIRNTVIMSMSKVKCLIIPRRFIFQHNPCNIWNRIRLFFNLYLPTEKQIIEYFASDRDWMNSKRKLSEEVVSMKNIPNYTLCCEIPYSIRMKELPR